MSLDRQIEVNLPDILNPLLLRIHPQGCVDIDRHGVPILPHHTPEAFPHPKCGGHDAGSARGI
jgi:hypothetical protein